MDEELNTKLLKRYCKENGYLSREMYAAVLLSLHLRSSGISTSVAYAMAFGRFLLGNKNSVDQELYREMSQTSSKVWRERGRSG